MFEVGSDCPAEFRHVNHRVDLFGSSSGLSFSAGPVLLFYAGTLTGHMYAKRVTSGFVPYAYGLGTAMAGPLATIPLTYLDVGNEDGTSSLAGDYMLGASVDVFGEGHARVAWVGTTGVYTNLTGTRVRLFAAAALDQLASLEYFRGGLDRQFLAQGIGFSSLYLRQKNLSAASADTTAVDQVPKRRFTTSHVAQENIGDIVDVHFAYALAPDLFVHDLRVGLHTPAYGRGKQVLREGKGMYDLEGMQDAGIMGIPLSASAGQVQLPELPWWGVEGGSKIVIEVEAFILFPSSDTGGLMLFYTFKANDPETLSSFPYAQDALSHYLTLQLF